MQQLKIGTAKWHHCACGAIFKDEESIGEPTDEDMKAFDEIKEIESRIRHYVITYVPLVEEYAQSRRFTWHGYCKYYFQNAMIDRGWISDPDTKTTDFIFSFHQLQHEADIRNYLRKCFNELTETGCLLIATPDTDFVHVLGPQHWGNWDCKKGNIYLNVSRLTRLLEEIGFQVVLGLQNTSARFANINDMHLLARKKVA